MKFRHANGGKQSDKLGLERDFSSESDDKRDSWPRWGRGGRRIFIARLHFKGWVYTENWWFFLHCIPRRRLSVTCSWFRKANAAWGPRWSRREQQPCHAALMADMNWLQSRSRRILSPREHNNFPLLGGSPGRPTQQTGNGPPSTDQHVSASVDSIPVKIPAHPITSLFLGRIVVNLLTMNNLWDWCKLSPYLFIE